MTVVKKLSFESHLKTVCKKVSNKYAVARACNNVSQQKLTIIMTAFTLCQFDCCPLVQMSHNRKCTLKGFKTNL